MKLSQYALLSNKGKEAVDPFLRAKYEVIIAIDNTFHITTLLIKLLEGLTFLIKKITPKKERK